MVDFSKYKQKEISPEVKKSEKISKKIDLKPINIERLIEKKSLRNIKNELDKIELTQDDLNSFIRQLCRNTLPTIRESKTDLTPIFLDFINKKLK